MKFKGFVEEMFIKLCGIETIDFAGEKQIMTWVNPMDSRYYSGLEV